MFFLQAVLLCLALTCAAVFGLIIGECSRGRLKGDWVPFAATGALFSAVLFGWGVILLPLVSGTELP